MTGLKYDFQFGEQGLYGHVVALLARYARRDDESIVLDLAAGVGAIAEPIKDRLGLRYVAADFDEDSVAELEQRGHEAHRIDLMSPDLDDELDRLIAGRRVAAVTLLDGLEHLVDGERALRAIRRIAAAHDAAVVVSVPNVSHIDVGVKLTLGEWTYTPTGLLDRTHVRFFGEEELTRELATHGLHPIDRNDFHLRRSDQHFPADHSALSVRSSLGRFLRARRRGAEPNGEVNQFVWALAPGPFVEPEPPVAADADAPFLSVVMRTQGRRPQEFREALLCLAGQTSTDFEVIVVGHDLDDDHLRVVEEAIDECAEELRARIRLLQVHEGTRSALLNAGFGAARGSYVAVLDDDDLVFAHWVETFARLVPKHGGKILRTRSADQEVERVEVRGRAGVRATSRYRTPWEADFSYVRHLISNQTPFMTAAFPASLYRDLGERFDETLTTTEDWDYLLRAASLVGVGTMPEITAIYRKWASEDSSATEHDSEEWKLNHNEVLRKLDRQPVLLPAGETRRIRRLYEETTAAKATAKAATNAAAKAAAEAAALRSAPPPPPEPTIDVEALTRILGIVESRSWRAFAPLRVVTRTFGSGPALRLSTLAAMTPEQLRAVAAELEASRSWRYSRVLRRTK